MKSDLPGEAQCKRASAVFNEVHEPGYRYAIRKKIGKRPVQDFMEADELWEGFPDTWEENVVSMLIIGSLFGRADRVAGFLRGTKEELRGDLLPMVRLWRDRPWVWAFVQVVEDLGDRRLVVKPIGAAPSTWVNPDDWGPMIVYSRTMTQNHDNGIELFFIQLVDIGPVFVTNGAVIPLRSFRPTDALFYADVVAKAGLPSGTIRLLGVPDDAIPVTDIAADDTVAFLALFRYSNTPAVRTPRGEPGRFTAVVELPDGADVWSEQPWHDTANAAGERVAATVIDADAAAIVFGEGSPMYDPTVYLSRPTRCAFLDARTREAYDRGRAATARLLAFPAAPDVVASFVALGAAVDICGLDESFQDECGVLRARFEERIDVAGSPVDADDGEQLPSSIDETRAIIDRLVRGHNEGIHEDAAAIAADLGVEPAVVDSLRHQLEASLSRMDVGMGNVAADRFGLSPRAFATLCRAAVPAVDGVLRLRDAQELRPSAQLITTTRYVSGVAWLLERAINRDGLPATQAGYISPRVVTDAYDDAIVRARWEVATEPILDGDASERLREHLRPRREVDLPPLLRVRRLAEDADLLLLSGKAFVPTDAARELVDDPVALYLHLIATAFRTFDWDPPGRFDPPPNLHAMSGFLYYAAGELCDARRPVSADDPDADWVPMQMLADRFIAAVPPIAEAVRRDAETYRERDGVGLGMWLRIGVQIGFAENFAGGFGLLETKGPIGKAPLFRTTHLYDQVFDRG
ncbi:MAG: hypothetical protein EA382_07205 [Spirochaetaceae bacterium]|nr:MAG: hypothetical protein EA382_07205 [Spirochaetaceae bacterium]